MKEIWAKRKSFEEKSS